MDKIVIVGGRPLVGEVKISGAKNAALPILASTLLSPGESLLSNIPDLGDVRTAVTLLQHLGMEIERDRDRSLIRVTGKEVARCEAPYDLVRTMRASVLVLGPLLARVGEARVSLPGGCAIGPRPVNLHLDGLARMGATISVEHGYITARAKKLKGAQIYLDTPTVTGTENLMMAATLAEGTTVLENTACEPEVEDLAHFLNKRGARIQGAGTPMIVIEGVHGLNGAEHSIIPDRIEAGTYCVAGAVTGGDLCVRGCIPRHLTALLLKLREAGVHVVEEENEVRVIAPPHRMAPVNVTTKPYPGFPTDMQAQMMVLMALAEGVSVVTETVFEDRFTHVPELRRMGADIRVHGNHAVITGMSRLSGAPVMASDLRASASLILAGLVAEGETEVLRVYHLDRGYERIEEKLSRVGARIKRIRG